jgi:hypothetical protein
VFDTLPETLPEEWVRSSWETWLERWPLLRVEVVDWLIGEYCATPLGHVTVKFRHQGWLRGFKQFLTVQAAKFEPEFVSNTFVSVPVTRFYERYEHLQSIKTKELLPYSCFHAAEIRGNLGVYACCTASKLLHKRTFDPSDRPQLPLPDCSQPNCGCYFTALSEGMAKRDKLGPYSD